MRLPDKNLVREELRAALERSLAQAVSAAESTRQGAVHEESRAEGDKDMRSTEQSYLARGQAMRVEELAEQLQRLTLTPLREYREDDAIGAGALVLVSIEDEPRIFFLVAQGGGTELSAGGARVTVIAPSSPVGAALSGRRAGDEFELTMRGAVRECVIERVA